MKFGGLFVTESELVLRNVRNVPGFVYIPHGRGAVLGQPAYTYSQLLAFACARFSTLRTPLKSKVCNMMNRIALTLLLALLGLPTNAVSQQDQVELADFQKQMLETAARLDLSEAQRAELEPILRARFQETERLLEKHGFDHRSGNPPGRRQLLALSRDLRPLREQTDREIEAILSKEQMSEYHDLQEERRAQMRAQLTSRAR